MSTVQSAEPRTGSMASPRTRPRTCSSCQRLLPAPRLLTPRRPRRSRGCCFSVLGLPHAKKLVKFRKGIRLLSSVCTGGGRREPRNRELRLQKSCDKLGGSVLLAPPSGRLADSRFPMLLLIRRGRRLPRLNFAKRGERYFNAQYP